MNLRHPQRLSCSTVHDPQELREAVLLRTGTVSHGAAYACGKMSEEGEERSEGRGVRKIIFREGALHCDPAQLPRLAGSNFKRDTVQLQYSTV